MYHVRLTEYAKKDYDKLDGSQRPLILKGFKHIAERGMTAGENLSGELVGCRKIKMREAGLRIVFHQKGDTIEVIEVVAIGKRDKSKVYKDAVRRLNH